MVIPEGIIPFVRGGGDCRILPWGSITIPRSLSVIGDVRSCCVTVGLRRDLLRYEDEPVDRGRCGRSVVTIASEVLRYEDDRLGTGVVVAEAAGESWEGGV